MPDARHDNYGWRGIQILIMRARLSLLYFLQFAVWGCYLTSLGQFLGAGGLGSEISWFYAAIGIVSILTPTLSGYIADRFVAPSRLLGLCHITAAGMMLILWLYAAGHDRLEFRIFYPLYLGFLAFYMPTMALANTASFAIIKSRGKQPVDVFPSIRIWGTVGFVCAMWMVNSTYVYDGHLGWTLSDSHPCSSHRFQYTSLQLMCAAITGFLAALYSYSLPSQKTTRQNGMPRKAFAVMQPEVLRQFFLGSRGKSATRRLSPVGIFLIFCAFTGVCMQISNGFATPFISHFMANPDYVHSLAAGNATMLFSLSQISEAVLIITAGKALKKYGIGIVFGAGLLAWSLRFFFFGIGNPGDGLIFLVLSMIIYGVAFNFITIAGHLHMERVSPEGMKGTGQGVMMLMSNGVGATVGIMGAGAVVNRWCEWTAVQIPGGGMMRLFMGDWDKPWFFFAGYAVILLAGWILYRRRYSDKSRSFTGNSLCRS